MHLVLNTLFYELLQVALDTRTELSRIPSAEEWKALYEEAKRQSVVGVCLLALQKEGGEWAVRYQVPINLKLLWIGKTEKIADRNRKLNLQCHQLSQKLIDSQRWCCILKGQAMAMLYPNPLWRQSGDIDIWVDGDRDELVNMVRRVTGRRDKVTYPHVDFHVFEDTPVELHFKPTWLFNPYYNHRLQKWIDSHHDIQKNTPFPIATTEFNVLYILLHIFRHIFDEGIGMRQIVDYYYVLKEAQGQIKPDLSYFGIERFTSGLMWVLQTTCNMPETWMIAKPDQRVGEWLLREIMLAGNFGHYDLRNQDIRHNTTWSKLFFRMRLSLRRVFLFPGEALCEMPWRIVHYFWRTIKFGRIDH